VTTSETAPRTATASNTPLRASTAGANLGIYARDGLLLGAFMVSACTFVALLEHPSSPVHTAIASAFVRRALVGAAMGITAVALIYSPWGKRTGAFMNPAMTLCFLRLGKLEARDALGYVVAQFAGGTLGVAVSALVLGRFVSDRAVNFAVTEPGADGPGVAWLAEFCIAFVLLSVVVNVNRVPRLARFGGVFAAALVALYITFEAPLSGMSLNPARSFASALVAGSFRGFWIYLTAPVLGMLAGVELDLRSHAGKKPCGKLSHEHSSVCFVRCDCLMGSVVHEPPRTAE
jgi:aquaporin Z